MSAEFSGRNYFEIFSLPEAFQVDESELTREYQKLQARYHPDKFAGASDQERRVALQSTSILNDAYETLRTPLRRAGYLLSLHGVDPEEHDQGHLGGEFLMEQMRLREELEGIAGRESLDELEAMRKRVEEAIAGELDRFRNLYDSGKYGEGKPVYHRLQFLYKLHSEIDQTEERILDY